MDINFVVNSHFNIGDSSLSFNLEHKKVPNLIMYYLVYTGMTV